jgi:hypothetical protein
MKAQVYNKLMKISFLYELFVGYYYCWLHPAFLLLGSSETFGVVEDGVDHASLVARDGGTGT